MNNILEVIQILNKYHCIIWAEHQLLGFRPSLDGTIIKEEDLSRLKELGVFYDRNNDSLCIWLTQT